MIEMEKTIFMLSEPVYDKPNQIKCASCDLYFESRGGDGTCCAPEGSECGEMVWRQEIN